MRADALRPSVGFRGRRESWCVVRPDRREWLERLGLMTAPDFLALPGVVVSGHVGRNVSRVEVGGATAYLKREHRVRWRDRFRSWRDGFGWESVSAREVAVLRRLEEHGLPGPKWLAVGEADGEAFVLLEGISEAVELRTLPGVGPTSPLSGRAVAAEAEAQRGRGHVPPGGLAALRPPPGRAGGDERVLPALGSELAERLGRTIARLHAAGVDQPDLFAKHFLISPATGELTILDWQRARLRRSVSWRRRVLGLASLAASAPDGVFPPAGWDRLIAAYHARCAAAGGHVPSRDELGRAVARSARLLRRRAGIRSQLAPAASQELVRIGGETVCAIPAVAGELNDPAATASLYAPGNDGWPVCFANGRLGVLRVRTYPRPFGRWWAAARGRPWRSPELKTARLLFHLERHGIAAPRLLAYGQKRGTAFVLSEPLTARPPAADDRGLVRDLLARLHAVGCRLRGVGPAGEPFGVRDGEVVIADPGFLRVDRRLTARHVRRDFARIEAFFRGAR